MKTMVITLFLAILLYSCGRLPKHVRLILDSTGDNRAELEKVIDYYKASGNKEKLQAAYFLIGNMQNKYAMDGDDVRKYDPIFDVFDFFTKTNTLLPPSSPVVFGKWDSLVKVFGYPSIQNADIISDCSHIKADYLIENIDLSFKLRDKSSWGRKISFEQFCEYVLAYRIKHEPLEHWRSEFYEKYKSLRDSVNADSIIQFARVIHEQVFPLLVYNRIFKEYPFDIPLDKMKTRRYGACQHFVIYTAMAMRSVGLPVAIDHAPTWGNHSTGHLWNAIILENGKIIPFDGEDSRFGWVTFWKIAKIYRETFANQNLELPENTKDVPQSLLDNYRMDVTHQYTKAYDIQIPLKYPTSKKKNAVICTFDNKNWISQDWGKIEKKQAHFKKMGSGIAYLAMYYDDGNLHPASDPFILDEEGKVSYLVPSKSETQNMHLVRKYPCHEWTQSYCNNMLNGSFQGANNSDFSDSVILFTVTKSPEKIETASITNPLKFKFIRYRSPFTGNGEVAELDFFGGNKSSDTLKLGGKLIGYPEIPPTIGTPYQSAFDDNLESYFGRVTTGSSWAGLDLGSPKRITKIKYCPRSDTNFILVGDTYELFYWDNGEWVSMGIHVARDQYLEYKNVPSGGLYILHNLTRGKEERIFTYEDGKQIWW